MFPLLSTALHATNVFPIVNALPDGTSQVTSVTSPELSVTLTEGSCQTATADACPSRVFNIWVPGQTSKTGASLSTK